MTTKTGIIYLQKDKFQIYSPYLPNIYEFRFVPEIIKDFDMVNRELLENLLKVFIVNNKLAAITLIIVIADNAVFIKDFLEPQVQPNPQAPANSQAAIIPPQTLEYLQNQANTYLDHVPFESVSSKTFPLANGVRAFATNEDIFNSIKIILEKMGFIVQGVLPGFAFGQEIANKQALDAQTITTIIANLNTVQEYNLLKGPEMIEPLALDENEEKSEEPAESAPRDNKKIILAVAISGIVLIFIITGVILYLQFTTKPYKAPPVTQTTSQVPVATPTAVQAAVPVDLKTLTAQINSSPNVASIAATLRSSFTTLGFKSVVPQTQESLGSSQNLLIFSSAVTPQAKTAITENVKKVVSNVLVQERADAAFDVVVILAK